MLFLLIMIYIKETEDFSNWLKSLTKKEQAKVKARIARIENDEHFGIVKNLGK